MKKYILLFFIASSLFGCKKDKNKPNGQVIIYSSQTAYTGAMIGDSQGFFEEVLFSKNAPDCNAAKFAVLTKPPGTYTIGYSQSGRPDRDHKFQVTVESGKCKSYDIYSYFK